MGKLFDLIAERVKREQQPEREWVRKGEDGQDEFCYVGRYLYKGVSYELEVWARDHDEADLHAEAIRATMAIRGQLLRTADLPRY